MITSWDRVEAKGIYESLLLVAETKGQKNRLFNLQLTDSNKLNAGSYACEGPRTNMHTPAMTKEDLDKIPMPKWDEHWHAWDNQGFCHSCGAHKHDND